MTDQDSKKPQPSIVNITGKTKFGDILLQSSPNVGLLQNQLRTYFENAIKTEDGLSETKKLQKILNTPANKIPELNMYKFEANQRVYELAMLLLIARSINHLHNRAFIPAWQLPLQDTVMKSFTEKESWDGFIYENPVDVSKPVATVPIEIKSTMIHPHKDTVHNPNQLLGDKLPKFKDYFQAEGSICALLVLPYSSDGERLSFDLKEATDNINRVVAYGAMGCVCLLSFPTNEKGDTVVTMHCHFVSKNPLLASNGKIDHVNLTKMEFGTISYQG